MNRFRLGWAAISGLAVVASLAAWPHRAALGDTQPPSVDLAEGPVIISLRPARH
jgi:hypothetical protein